MIYDPKTQKTVSMKPGKVISFLYIGDFIMILVWELTLQIYAIVILPIHVLQKMYVTETMHYLIFNFK